jgi:hypothetical protein
MVNPLNRVTLAINEVSEGFSDQAISVPDYAETVHIIDAFNKLLSRMNIIDYAMVGMTLFGQGRKVYKLIKGKK